MGKINRKRSEQIHNAVQQGLLREGPGLAKVT